MKTSESSICLYIHAYLAKREIVKHKKNIQKYQIFQHTEMWARKDFQLQFDISTLSML